MLRKQNKQKKKTLRRIANYINSLQGRVPAVLRHFGQVGTLPHKQFCLPGINAASAHHNINQRYSLLIACPIKNFNQLPAKEAKHSELIKDRKLSGIKGRKKGPSCKPWIVETLQESKQCSCWGFPTTLQPISDMCKIWGDEIFKPCWKTNKASCWAQ